MIAGFKLKRCATVAFLGAATPLQAAPSFDPLLEAPADTPGSIVIVQPQAVPLTPTVVPATRSEGAVPSGNPLWSIPLSALSATRERPVFSPSRRPPPRAVVALPPPPQAAAPPPPPPPPEPLTLTLVGAVVSDTEAIAILFDRTNQGVVRLRSGQAYGGWVVNSVLPREVTLTRGNQTETIGLPKGGEPSVSILGAGMSTVPGVGVPGVGVPGVGVPGVGVSVPGMSVSGGGASGMGPSGPLPTAVPGVAVPGVSNPGSGAVVPGVAGRNGYAPYVPRSTPKDGSSDGL